MKAVIKANIDNKRLFSKIKNCVLAVTSENKTMNKVRN